MQTSRITDKLNKIKEEGSKAFIPFITAGYPCLEETEKLILNFAKWGCSVIELGVPFSDPMADGPVIQKANDQALENGVTLEQIIALVKKVRQKTQVPILLMGYYNPLFQYGLDRFAKDAHDAGVDGVLIVDLPVEEVMPLKEAIGEFPIDIIYLLTPTSSESRIKLVAGQGSGFVYYVSYTGITGDKSFKPSEVKKQIKRIRKHITLPINIGFGISTPEHVAQLAPVADGVVVGSALIKIIEKIAANELYDFHLKQTIEQMIRALDARR
ncbi:MAG: tryptophan synthase subunit alpha [bacterium]|nr:tryptophan synthase subunit alpha [bacterium]MBU1918497.1 tryptophan synthase subunit alpha [bacterium]